MHTSSGLLLLHIHWLHRFIFAPTHIWSYIITDDKHATERIGNQPTEIMSDVHQHSAVCSPFPLHIWTLCYRMDKGARMHCLCVYTSVNVDTRDTHCKYKECTHTKHQPVGITNALTSSDSMTCVVNCSPAAVISSLCVEICIIRRWVCMCACIADIHTSQHRTKK